MTLVAPLCARRARMSEVRLGAVPGSCLMRRIAFVRTYVTDEPAVYEISLTLLGNCEQCVGFVYIGVDFVAHMERDLVCGALSWAYLDSFVGTAPWRSPNA